MNSEITIEKASQILKKNRIISHELDAQIILSEIWKIKREYLITNNEITITKKNEDKYNAAIQRRVKNEPVAYITGKKEFWSEDFLIRPGVLIPRPETELLIYKIIKFFKNKNINILDIGTGSGCILLSILKELNLSRGIGIDISSEIINVANLNSKKLKLTHRSKFKAVDFNNFSKGKFDLIVSNPPYIPTREIKSLSKDIINYEPITALDGGVDGLDLIKKVIYKSNHLLKREGMLALEIGHNQYQRVFNVLKDNGYREIGKEYDINRNVRCIMSTKVNFF